jgi:hypothetical protein
MSRSRKSGGKIGSILTFFVIGACIIGFYGIPSDPDIHDVPQMLKSKSNTVNAWMNNCVPGAVKGDFSHCSLSSNVQSGGNTGTPGTGTPGDSTAPGTSTGAAPVAKNQALQDLTSIKVANSANVSYDRSQWKHWISQGSSCWDTRDQVLYRDAIKDNSLVLTNSSGKTVTNVKDACTVKAGTWSDPYTGNKVTDPRALDIDHVIPLGYAADHGGQAWNAAKKQAYANDISNSYHLRAVGASPNRAKGDRGPSEWKPYAGDSCNYATSWVEISKNYGLSASAADVKVLKDMLATCR